MEIVAVSSLFGTGSGGQTGALGALEAAMRGRDVEHGPGLMPQAWACSWPENEAGDGGLRRVPSTKYAFSHGIFELFSLFICCLPLGNEKKAKSL